MFFLSDDRIDLRLKSYKALSTNGKTTLTIVCETSDHYELGYALRALDDVAKGQKAAELAQAAAAKGKGKPKAKPMLALPAPLRALPSPGGAA